MTVKPRHVICVLNNDQNVIRNLCKDFPGFYYDEEFSVSGRQLGMDSAFLASMDRLIPSFSADDQNAVEKHTAVNYVLSESMDVGAECDISLKMLSFVAAAFHLGALAVKGESSGIAHGRKRWLELYERSKDKEQQISALYRAWVRLPISDSSKFYSVGMHLLGMRDAEIESSETAIEDLDMFLLYLSVDGGDSKIVSGETFSKDQRSSVYGIDEVRCSRFPEDDFFHNPYGVWSLQKKD